MSRTARTCSPTSRSFRNSRRMRAGPEDASATMPGSAPKLAKSRPRVGLFVTCLVDLFRPSIGFASVKLLTDAGCEVDVPTAQTCCGQPAYNSGDKSTAQQLARQTIAAFET